MSKYLTRPEQADFLTNELGLPITKATLQKKASTGGGPPYSIFGNKALSTREQLKKWAEAQLSKPRRSTSEREEK